MSSRRGRRRSQRARAHRPPRPRRSLASRLIFLVLGVVMVAAGVGLLIGGGGSNRLFRVAGILIVVGAVIAIVGIIGG